MAAAFDDPACLEHDDLVGMHDRRQPVRDHDRGPAALDIFERALDLGLGAAVERAGRLVEDQDRRVLEQRARDRDALLLAARQLQPALADPRLIAEWLAFDELGDRRAARRALDLVLLPRPRGHRRCCSRSCR